MKTRRWDVLLGASFVGASAGGAVMLVVGGFEHQWGLALAALVLGVLGVTAAVTRNVIARRWPSWPPFGARPTADEGRARPDRLIVLVRPDREDIYDTLRKVFAHEAGVDVIMERRVGERRQRDGDHTPERRRGDRRANPAIDAALKERGWAVLRIPRA